MVIAGNIGEIYFDNNNNDKAVEYFNKAIKAADNGPEAAFSYNGIGKINLKQGKYELALKNHNTALANAKKVDDKFQVIRSLRGIADVYENQGNTSLALDYYNKARTIAEQMDDVKVELKDLYKDMSAAYSKSNDFQNAFLLKSLYSDIKDTLYNLETKKKLNQLQFDFELSKKEGEIVLQEAKIKSEKQQLDGGLFLTDGGLETTLIFHQGIDLPAFAAFTAPGRGAWDGGAAPLLPALSGPVARPRRRVRAREPDLAREPALGGGAGLLEGRAGAAQPQGDLADGGAARVARRRAPGGDQRVRRAAGRRLRPGGDPLRRRRARLPLDPDRDLRRDRGRDGHRDHDDLRRRGDRDHRGRCRGRDAGRDLVHGGDRRPAAERPGAGRGDHGARRPHRPGGPTT